MRHPSHARERNLRAKYFLLRVVTGLCSTVAIGPSPAGADYDDSAAGMSGNTSHTVVKGDTLWDLSGRYLGSSYEWPRLWSYNPEITNPHWIYPGGVLRLREGAEVGEPVAAGGPGGAGGKNPLLNRYKGALGSMRGNVVVGEQTYLDEKALREAARIVGSPQDHMMFSPSDEVYVQFQKNEELKEGKELLVFRRLHESEVSPKAGKSFTKIHYAGDGGEIVQVLGSLRVRSVDPDKRIARAVIMEALDPIERGFEVSDVPRTMADVAPKVNSRKVESTIVAATRPLAQLGQNQLVFIGAGSKQGVEVGNRFVVLRQGDPWRQNLPLNERMSGEERPERHPLSDKEYPWHAVGEARVIYLREETSTALITDSLVELTPGDRVELREGY